ncbi:MAG: hypothetical protein AB8G22_20605 [Saprospiraceae bacterium]
MKYLITCCCLLFAFTTTHAQFRTDAKEMTIIVTDGTAKGKNSDRVTTKSSSKKSNIPQSYDQNSGRRLAFTDPIRSLGMSDCIQAAAFLERPSHGVRGFMLIFSVNDAIGGKQAVLTTEDGRTYQGVYRLIRQKISTEEPTPSGMTDYKAEGTFFLLGIS